MFFNSFVSWVKCFLVKAAVSSYSFKLSLPMLLLNVSIFLPSVNLMLLIRKNIHLIRKQKQLLKQKQKQQHYTSYKAKHASILYLLLCLLLFCCLMK